MKKSLLLSTLFLSSLYTPSFAKSSLTIDDLVKLIPLSSRQELEKANTYLEELEKQEEIGWGSYHVIVQNLITRFNAKIACEVGVSTGLNSYKMLKNTTLEKLYSIDPYISYGDPTNVNLSQHTFDVMYYRFLKKLEEFGNRACVLRMMSTDAAKLFSNNTFDFVFLDANHTYPYVKKDLEDYYPLVKPGGILAGDDYATCHPGVPQAVNEFFAEKNIIVNQDSQEPRIWWVQKPLL